MTPELIKAIAVTARLMGMQMDDVMAEVFAGDLSAYPERQVLAALTRCRKECRGRLTVAEVVSRIDDGRPGVEESWALLPKSEADSGAMTAEMLAGYAVAIPLLEEGRHVDARMAFKEVYVAAVQRARDAGEEVHWRASLGHAKAGRHDAEQEAERRQALADGREIRLLERRNGSSRIAHLEQSATTAPDKAREVIAALRKMAGGQK